MKNIFKKYLNIKKKNQKAYTLLEYCAGAAIIAGIVFTALSNLGGSMSDYLGSLSGWVATRAGEVDKNGTPDPVTPKVP
jgi:hypothetical protein